MQTFRSSDRISSDAFSDLSEGDPETLLSTKIPAWWFCTRTWLTGDLRHGRRSFLLWVTVRLSGIHLTPESAAAGLSACQIDLGFLRQNKNCNLTKFHCQIYPINSIPRPFFFQTRSVETQCQPAFGDMQYNIYFKMHSNTLTCTKEHCARGNSVNFCLSPLSYQEGPWDYRWRDSLTFVRECW
jgi:hypothetical protein